MELKVKVKRLRVAQMIILPYPKVHLVETEALKDSDRGTGGYGSSGD